MRGPAGDGGQARGGGAARVRDRVGPVRAGCARPSGPVCSCPGPRPRAWPTGPPATSAPAGQEGRRGPGNRGAVPRSDSSPSTCAPGSGRSPASWLPRSLGAPVPGHRARPGGAGLGSGQRRAARGPSCWPGTSTPRCRPELAGRVDVLCANVPCPAGPSPPCLATSATTSRGCPWTAAPTALTCSAAWPGGPALLVFGGALRRDRRRTRPRRRPPWSPRPAWPAVVVHQDLVGRDRPGRHAAMRRPRPPDHPRLQGRGAVAGAGRGGQRDHRQRRAGRALTDTLYGVGCDPFNPSAVDALFQAKQRGRDLLPAGAGATWRQAIGLVDEVTDQAQALIAAWWPGPLTLVLRRPPGSAGTSATRGARWPCACPSRTSLALIQQTGPWPCPVPTAPASRPRARSRPSSSSSASTSGSSSTPDRPPTGRPVPSST